eukprot:96781_1
MRNDTESPEHRWDATDLIKASEIGHRYGIQSPDSSREAPWFQNGLKRPPECVCADIICSARFDRLPRSSLEIDEKYLKRYCYPLSNEGILVSAVVIECMKQWIEWKKCMTIRDESGKELIMNIALRMSK